MLRSSGCLPELTTVRAVMVRAAMEKKKLRQKMSSKHVPQIACSPIQGAVVQTYDRCEHHHGKGHYCKRTAIAGGSQANSVTTGVTRFQSRCSPVLPLPNMASPRGYYQSRLGAIACAVDNGSIEGQGPHLCACEQVGDSERST